MKTNEYIKELQNKSIEDLNKDLVSAKEELFSLRFQNATNQLENTSSLKSVRKKIARIKTVITEKAKAAQ
ncbi:MAG: 50S ribosomal protein L29 [Lachnospiraceae bacterium]